MKKYVPTFENFMANSQQASKGHSGYFYTHSNYDPMIIFATTRVKADRLAKMVNSEDPHTLNSEVIVTFEGKAKDLTMKDLYMAPGDKFGASEPFVYSSERRIVDPNDGEHDEEVTLVFPSDSPILRSTFENFMTNKRRASKRHSGSAKTKTKRHIMENQVVGQIWRKAIEEPAHSPILDQVIVIHRDDSENYTRVTTIQSDGFTESLMSYLDEYQEEVEFGKEISQEEVFTDFTEDLFKMPKIQISTGSRLDVFHILVDERGGWHFDLSVVPKK